MIRDPRPPFRHLGKPGSSPQTTSRWAVFAIAKVRDSDRGMARTWTVFANDLTVIELLEDMRVGEPVAIAGPFTVARERDFEYRISAKSVIDVKRRKKPKGQIAKEQRIEFE